jgi:hypothetical protein
MTLGRIETKTVATSLIGFGGQEVLPVGTVDLPTSMGKHPCRSTRMVTYLIVNAPNEYNVILGRPALNDFETVIHLSLKNKIPHSEWSWRSRR